MNTKILDRIGLGSYESKDLTEMMNALLSNYSIFSQNLQSYYWNIHGASAFGLGQKFLELRKSIEDRRDEIIERILILGAKPHLTFSSYLKESEIPERLNVKDSKTSVKQIIEGISHLIALQRDILLYSEEFHDEGTHSLMSSSIIEQEKLIRVYTNFLIS